MTRARTLLGRTILAACLVAPGGIAFAQQSGGLLGDLFNGGQQQAQQTPPPAAVEPQGGGGVNARIDRIENVLRQLTGQIEVLQYQNRLLHTQIKRMQDDTEYRFQQMGRGQGGAPARPAGPGQRSQAVPPMQNQGAVAGPQPLTNQAASTGQGDAFNPALNPNAPGAPRPLSGEVPGQALNNAPVGVPGGREAGAPLDLSSLAGTVPGGPAAAPDVGPAGPGGPPASQVPPSASQVPPRNPTATGTQLATLPPSAAPKDEYELAYGYVLRKDYGLAAQTFRDFLRKFPKDQLAPAAQYWLGESLYQQQNYDEAARAFLAVSTKYKHYNKAPDALLRLGQSLAALNHKEAACATLTEVKNKFPNASSGVKRGVARELKRVRC